MSSAENIKSISESNMQIFGQNKETLDLRYYTEKFTMTFITPGNDWIILMVAITLPSMKNSI